MNAHSLGAGDRNSSVGPSAERGHSNNNNGAVLVEPQQLYTRNNHHLSDTPDSSWDGGVFCDEEEDEDHNIICPTTAVSRSMASGQMILVDDPETSPEEETNNNNNNNNYEPGTPKSNNNQSICNSHQKVTGIQLDEQPGDHERVHHITILHRYYDPNDNDEDRYPDDVSSISSRGVSEQNPRTPQQQERKHQPTSDLVHPDGAFITVPAGGDARNDPTAAPSPLSFQSPAARQWEVSYNTEAAEATARLSSPLAMDDEGMDLESSLPQSAERNTVDEDGLKKQSSKRRRYYGKWLGALAALIMALGAVVGGICAASSENCRASASTSTSKPTQQQDTTSTATAPQSNDDTARTPTFTHAPPFLFNTTQLLYQAVDDYLLDARAATAKYGGPMESWDVSRLRDFSYVCASTRQPLCSTLFNVDVSAWDVSRADTLFAMFRGARSFAQDLCAWGDRLRPTANTTGMFAETFCESTSDPAFAPNPDTGIYVRLEPWCVRQCDDNA